jgi:hypothetical protein
MFPSDLPGFKFGLRRSALRLQLAPLLCFRYGPRCFIPEFTRSQLTLFSLPGFEFLRRGLAPGILKNKMYRGAGL